MPGVSDANIEILAPNTLRRNPKVANQYILENENGRNGKVDIIVRDRLNGITAAPVTFQVVKLPKPNAYVSKEELTRIKRSALAAGTVRVKYSDERLQRALNPVVTSFKLRIGPSAAGSSKSNKFTTSQKAKIKKAKKNTPVIIYDIKYASTTLRGNPTAQNSVALTLQ